jgi:hypothetical protein
MKSIAVLVLCFFGASQVLGASSGPANMDCGIPPNKKPSECCPDLSKVCTDAVEDKCEADCKNDICCNGNCIGKAIKMFNSDGKFDKDLANKTLTAVFGSDKAWADVRKQINILMNISIFP